MLRTLVRTAPPMRQASTGLWQWLSDARAVRRQRSRLTDLDARMLRDIGVSDAEALQEARRALWDVPQRWRR